MLIAADLVEPRYINAMIETIKELGLYCLITPGNAIPHARPEMSVVKTGYSAITLLKPVEFGNHDNDPVFLVLEFCALGHDLHIKALALMTRTLFLEGFIDRVKQANFVSTFKIIKIHDQDFHTGKIIKYDRFLIPTGNFDPTIDRRLVGF